MATLGDAGGPPQDPPQDQKGHVCPRCGGCVCPDCKCPATGLGKMELWIKDLLKIAVIPIAVVCLGQLWKESLTEKATIEEAGRRQRARLDEIARQTDIAVESMAVQMEKTLPLGQKSIEMRNALTDGCAMGVAARDREACLGHYLGVLKGLDEFVSGLSWQMDTFPVTKRTYEAFDALKQRYWESCNDDWPEERCGWRQIIVRYIYGIGTPQRIALVNCRGDNRLEQHNRACHTAITHVRKAVAEALGDGVNCVMCDLIEEVKHKRGNNMQRLAAQERTVRQENGNVDAESRDNTSILAQLAQDLAARSKDSQCAKIIERCKKSAAESRMDKQ